MFFLLFLIFIYLFIIIFLLKLINSAAQNHCLPRQKDAYEVRLGIYMFVHENNVSMSCTVPLLTLHKAAYLQIAYGKLHSATFQQYTLVG